MIKTYLIFAAYLILSLAGINRESANAAPHSIKVAALNRQQITGWGIYTENRPDWNPVEDFNISMHPKACDALYGPQGITLTGSPILPTLATARDNTLKELL